jgi:hypothetical protein
MASTTGRLHTTHHMQRNTRTMLYVILGIIAAVVAVILLLTYAGDIFNTATPTSTTPSSAEDYAPYTAGPVVPETDYSEYSDSYAPYTAGPVVPQEEPYGGGGR